MLKYYRKIQGLNTPKTEITYDKALELCLGAYRDNDMTRDMLTIPNNIKTMLSTIYVEDKKPNGMTMVLMAGLYNQLPMGVEYDKDGNHV